MCIRDSGYSVCCVVYSGAPACLGRGGYKRRADTELFGAVRTCLLYTSISDPNVSRAKAIFAVWGWYTGDVTNPYFDGELEAAITEYQAYNDLFPYGVLDLTTQRQLYKDLTETTVEIDNQFDAALSHFGITLAENN